MARQVLPIAGAVIGSFFGMPQLGFAIGSIIGNAVDPMQVKGPSIGDIAVQTSRDGVPRPIVFGVAAVFGNIIDRSEPKIVKKKERQGKGGPETVTEHVYMSFAIRICEGPITSISRIWENEKLIYDGGDTVNFPVGVGAIGKLLGGASFANHGRIGASIYYGGEDQLPDPTFEAIHGVGNTPAYRGTAYIVFKDKDLTEFGGAIPQYRFEVNGQNLIVTSWAFATLGIVGSSSTLAGLATYATTTPSPAISFTTASLPNPFVDSSFILLPAASAKYALSADGGATYTTYNTPNAQTINGVAYGSGYYWIACGTDVYKSTDCVAWTAVTMPTVRGRNSIATLGSIIAIGSTNGVVTKSTDGGANWADVTLSGFTTNDCDVHASATCIMAFPTALGKVTPINLRRTTDGNTWAAITNPYNVASSNWAIATNSGNDWMMFAGNQAYITSTDDGLTWTKVTGTPNSRSIYSAWAGGGYWAIGSNNGFINYSDDFGASWTEIYPTANQITHVFSYES